MLKEEKHIESRIEKKNPEERNPKLAKKEEPLRHPKKRGAGPVEKDTPLKQSNIEHKIIDSKRHAPPVQEEIEVMINLCGNKKELIDVLNYINHIIIETPKKVDSKIIVRK